MPKPLTVKAVVIYAAKLRTQGDHEAATDPYASPYRPSEAAARKMCARFGPDAAIAQMRKRSAMHTHEAREDAARAATALSRLAQRHERDRRDQQARAQGLTPGARIDQALAKLAVAASPPAAPMDSDTVHGGEKNTTPRWSGDGFARARVRALVVADELERLVDECQRRDLTRAA